ncbi:hypothetical protein FB45DRAFT_1114332 [Roridomyces roridus]|uniref:Uncharacterized protein n=1 Tax=Roridomyces roridus TaxID=1738132 RepID=A0AAD7FXP6_9AGAR|nr:hypothetical protein FB45DRAFT_1114332 [Roridomyces roridus]
MAKQAPRGCKIPKWHLSWTLRRKLEQIVILHMYPVAPAQFPQKQSLASGKCSQKGFLCDNSGTCGQPAASNFNLVSISVEDHDSTLTTTLLGVGNSGSTTSSAPSNGPALLRTARCLGQISEDNPRKDPDVSERLFDLTSCPEPFNGFSHAIRGPLGSTSRSSKKIRVWRMCLTARSFCEGGAPHDIPRLFAISDSMAASITKFRPAEAETKSISPPPPRQFPDRVCTPRPRGKGLFLSVATLRRCNTASPPRGRIIPQIIHTTLNLVLNISIYDYGRSTHNGEDQAAAAVGGTSVCAVCVPHVDDDEDLRVPFVSAPSAVPLDGGTWSAEWRLGLGCSISVSDSFTPYPLGSLSGGLALSGGQKDEAERQNHGRHSLIHTLRSSPSFGGFVASTNFEGWKEKFAMLIPAMPACAGSYRPGCSFLIPALTSARTGHRLPSSRSNNWTKNNVLSWTVATFTASLTACRVDLETGASTRRIATFRLLHEPATAALAASPGSLQRVHTPAFLPYIAPIHSSAGQQTTKAQ